MRGQHEVVQSKGAIAEGKRLQKAEVARAEGVIAEVIALETKITSAFWEIGRLLNEMRDGALHRLLGFERFEELIEARFSFSRSVASRLMTVAAQLPKPEATRLGQERAYAVIAYARSAGPAREVDPVALVRSDAPIVPGKPLSETPVREILAARSPKPVPLRTRAAKSEDATMMREVKKHLTQLGLPKASVSVRGAKVVVTWARGQWERRLKDE